MAGTTRLTSRFERVCLPSGAEQAGLGTKSPQPYEDEQLRHLLGGDDSKVHNKLPSLQDDVLDEQRNTAVLGVEKFHRRILGEDLGRDLYLDAAGGVDAAALHPADAGGETVTGCWACAGSRTSLFST